FISPRHVTIVEPSGAVTPGNVQFDNLRRIMVGVLAFPAQLRVEPFAGGGFAIMEALNVQVSCASCTGSDLGQLQDEADRAATKAFFCLMSIPPIHQKNALVAALSASSWSWPRSEPVQLAQLTWTFKASMTANPPPANGSTRSCAGKA